LASKEAAMTPFPTAIAAVSDIIAIRRESVRGVLALIIVGLLVVYSLGILLYIYLGGAAGGAPPGAEEGAPAGADAQILISGVFTPIIGIVGTVLGFYFGSQQKED
jgi:hypothetical protein